MKKSIQEKFLSKSRLEAYNNFEEYETNINLSKQYYTLLSILEVSLRNSINCYFERHIDENWMDSNLLNSSSKRKITDVRSRFSILQDNISNDKIISELSFGFWTSLFKKDYSTIMRIKTIKSIFPNIPNQNEKFIDRHYINKKLNTIRVFRNRIFHYEKIINKQEFMHIEDDIYEILEYFDREIKEFAMRLNNV